VAVIIAHGACECERFFWPPAVLPHGSTGSQGGNSHWERLLCWAAGCDGALLVWLPEASALRLTLRGSEPQRASVG